MGHTCLPPLRSVIQTPDHMSESWWLFSDDQQFTIQNFDQLYVLVFSAHKTTHSEMTSTVLKAMLKFQINQFCESFL